MLDTRWMEKKIREHIRASLAAQSRGERDEASFHEAKAKALFDTVSLERQVVDMWLSTDTLTATCIQ